MREDRLARIARRNIVEPDQRRGQPIRLRKLERELRIPVRRRDQLHLLQLLDAALRLRRLGGLGLETVDEALQVRDLPLLLLVGGRLQRQTLCALLLELRIVAGVERHGLAVHVQRVRRDRVEELAVVGDADQRAFVGLEPVLHPEHGVEVQVIGRLVEQHEVRAAHQRARQVQAHAPAAGEARDRLALLRAGESQAVQQSRGAAARGVAADGVEPVVDLADALRVVALFGVGEPPLQVAKLDVAVERVLDRKVGQGRRFLRHGGDAQVLGHGHLADVAVQLAEDRREQRRLAGAVAADQARVPAGIDRERDFLEQLARPAAESDVVEGKHAARSVGRAARAVRSPRACRYCFPGW